MQYGKDPIYLNVLSTNSNESETSPTKLDKIDSEWCLLN